MKQNDNLNVTFQVIIAAETLQNAPVLNREIGPGLAGNEARMSKADISSQV